MIWKRSARAPYSLIENDFTGLFDWARFVWVQRQHVLSQVLVGESAAVILHQGARIPPRSVRMSKIHMLRNSLRERRFASASARDECEPDVPLISSITIAGGLSLISDFSKTSFKENYTTILQAATTMLSFRVTALFIVCYRL